jgi:hypothetical protein
VKISSQTLFGNLIIIIIINNNNKKKWEKNNKFPNFVWELNKNNNNSEKET